MNCDSNSIAVIILTQITVLCAGLTGKGDSVKYMKENLKLWFDQACFVCLLTFSSRQDGTCLLIKAHTHSTLSQKFAYVAFGKARQLEHRTVTLLRQVQFSGAAWDFFFFLESTFSADSLLVSIHPHMHPAVGSCGCRN